MLTCRDERVTALAVKFLEGKNRHLCYIRNLGHERRVFAPFLANPAETQTSHYSTLKQKLSSLLIFYKALHGLIKPYIKGTVQPKTKSAYFTKLLFNPATLYEEGNTHT